MPTCWNDRLFSGARATNLWRHLSRAGCKGHVVLAELDDIYSTRILELASGISSVGRLAAPDGTATTHSKLCGSTVTVDLAVADGRVADYGQIVKACLLGQTACAVMGHEIIGSSREELRQVAATMRAMLKANGPPPGGRWADLAVLEPVRAFKGRHASVMLVFEAVEAAFQQAEARQTDVQALPSA
jgi:NifU-like protein involved in Fe-S cluster formation